MTRFSLKLLLFVTIIGLFQFAGGSAHAGASEPYFEKARGAWAYWSYTDATGCIYTNVELFGYQAVVTSDYRELVVWINQENRCVYATTLINARGYAPASSLNVNIGPNLSYANLNMTLDVFDTVSSSTIQATIDVDLAGTSPILTSLGDDFPPSPTWEDGVLGAGFELPSQHRTATASGTAVIDGIDYTSGRPSDVAEIGIGGLKTINVAPPGR
jgi:hypothetical protein